MICNTIEVLYIVNQTMLSTNLVGNVPTDSWSLCTIFGTTHYLFLPTKPTTYLSYSLAIFISIEFNLSDGFRSGTGKVIERSSRMGEEKGESKNHVTFKTELITTPPPTEPKSSLVAPPPTEKAKSLRSHDSKFPALSCEKFRDDLFSSHPQQNLRVWIMQRIISSLTQTYKSSCD